MDSYLLPATTYQSPPRLVRKPKLNTIIEDEYTEDEEMKFSDESASKAGRGRMLDTNVARSVDSTSPVPSLTSSTSTYYRTRRRSRDFDDLYDVSDDDSQDDYDITPGMFPRAGSSRSTSPESMHRLKSDSRKVPSLIIPSPGHWPTIQKLQNGSPPLPPKIPISPAILSLLPHDRQSMSSHPPSLDGSSTSDALAASSAPTTPDMQVHHQGQDVWGQTKNKKNQSPRSPHLAGSTTSEARFAEDTSPCWGMDDFENGMIIRDFGFGECRPAPDSPILGSEDGASERGVQLPPEALDTLQHLSLEIPAPVNVSPDPEPLGEMTEVQDTPPRPNSADFTPMSTSSDYSISRLSIPSPGDFFSSLGPNARHTWCHTGSGPLYQAPPSSTTAEQFYNCPWNRDPQATVERVIEFDDDDTEGPPTARQPLPKSGKAEEGKSEEGKSYFERSPVVVPPPDSPKDYDEDYEKAIQLVAESSLDRTSVWLAHQTSYMAGLRETNPVNEIGIALSPSRRVSQHFRDNSMGSPMKKAVRFLESQTAQCRSPKTAKIKSDSIYYHAFQHILNDRTRQDAFRHRHTRSDSLQAGRIVLPHEHIERLQGHYRLTESDRPVPLRPVSMFPGSDESTAEQTTEQKVIAQVERERQALDQVSTIVWVIEAYKYLNGGSLLHSPAARFLKCADRDEAILSADYVRILDLGGQPNCDWAWHCAREFTNTKVYTANADTHHSPMNELVRGPSNHRLNLVSNLYTLPYPDSQFTAISMRSIFAHLKTVLPPGLTSSLDIIDEYDLCLRECLRVLKPGGYLEFFLLDSEIVHAGPLASAMSVEFGFNLKTRGYDPSPTKPFLGRLRRAGFVDIKRAWTFLPMGAPTKDAYVPPETPPPNVSTYDLHCGKGEVEAVHGPVGSTADAASMSGLVGSWAWEQWMLKLQLEMGREGESLLEGVPGVLEEGRAMGAGWRSLSGWARKGGECD